MPRFLRGLVAALAVCLLAAPAAPAETTVRLNLKAFADMVVDAAHKRVFVSGGSGSSSVVVLDFNGNIVKTIGSQPGAAGMARVRKLELPDLSGAASYPTGAYPVAVAVSADGAHVAGGRDASYDPDVYVFRIGSLTPLRSWDFGTMTLYRGGLAFSPDGSRLFVASRVNIDGGLVFRVLGSPTTRPGASPLTLTGSAWTVTYNRKVTLTAHLKGVRGATVSIYATPSGGEKTLVKRGAVDASGNFTTAYTMKRKTTFAAEWTTAETYAESASRTVNVRVIAGLRLTGYYGTSGVHKLYRLGTEPELAGRVRPAHPTGQPLEFVAQRSTGGGWRTIDRKRFRDELGGYGPRCPPRRFARQLPGTEGLPGWSRLPRQLLALGIPEGHVALLALDGGRPASRSTSPSELGGPGQCSSTRAALPRRTRGRTSRAIRASSSGEPGMRSIGVAR